MMSVSDVPEECITDPQCVQILNASLITECTEHEKLLTDLAERIRQLKLTIKKGMENRKKIKQQIKDNKDRKIVINPLLEQLSYNACQQSTKLHLLKKELDESSLKREVDHMKYRNLLDSYRKAWDECQAEYENTELAMTRKSHKNEYEKLKVESMIKQYKKKEFQNMIKQRKKIRQRRIQSITITSSKLMLDIWRSQDCADSLENEIKNIEEDWHNISQKHNDILKHLKSEAQAKALAKQQMPIPKLNLSLVRTLYVDPRHMKEYKYQTRRIMDPDTLSVNTIMFEEMCSNEENIESTMVDKSRQSAKLPPLFQEDSSSEVLDNDTQPMELSMVKLENRCSEMNINEEILNISNRNIVKNITETVLESQLKSQPIYEKISTNENDPLKLTPSTSKPLDADEDEVQRKKMKLTEVKKADASNKLPVIKKIETLTHPITIQQKPPMAEVPPTPSSLFSPHYYAPSYASSGNLSHCFDTNYIAPVPDICEMDNFSENWPNLSPPHVGSEISFASTNFQGKNLALNDDSSNFMTQPQKPAAATSNFLNFLSNNSANPKSLF